MLYFVITMGYEVAIEKAWKDLADMKPQSDLSVRFFNDSYAVDLAAKKLSSLSCNIPAKDFMAILLLHYLARKLRGLPELSNEWLTFREFSGIEGYYEAFRKRSIAPLIRKYGHNPQGIFESVKRISGQPFAAADAAVVIEAFKGVPVLVKVWKQDDEFSADANIYFDRSITGIFCTEDIVVLAGFVAGALWSPPG